MAQLAQEDCVFGDIAVCLSGGGYRAAAFHLGSLDLLNQLGLLPQVKLLSTVSGGTIIGMSYAVARIEERSFGAFYQSFYEFLRQRNVVEAALENLYENAAAAAAQSPSLIRAAAQVYANELFQERRLKLLLDKVGGDFNELIFNATEFRVGNSFRFRASQNAQTVIGNKAFRVERNVAEQIRLADIVAASSCFPAAFEPMRFPDDFAWNDLAAIRQQLKSGFKDEQGNDVAVPLMDGGIYDNQGIDSAKLALPDDDTSFGLWLICDTNQRDNDVYHSPVQARQGWLTLRWVVWALRFVSVLSLVSAGAVAWQFWRKLKTVPFMDYLYAHPYELLFVYAIPFLLALAVAGGLWWIRRMGQKLRMVEFAGSSFVVWDVAQKLTMPDLIEMLKARLGSLIALTNNVYLKRVRSLVVQSVFADSKRREKVAFNVLYELLLTHDALKKKDPDLQPSPALQAVAARAERMPTTLWFADEAELQNLIVCGQATTCFNLLRFLQDRHSETLRDPQSAASQLYQQLKEKWLVFNREPAGLLKR